MTTTHKLLVLAAILVPAVAFAQQAPLTVALYAPTAPFADSSARFAYVQGIARVIQAKTGVPTTGKAYVRLADLLAAKPDFAILDGQCIAARSPGAVLATASIGGETAQAWALFARGGEGVSALKGKRLAFVKTGCRDTDFLDNALLDGEVRTSVYFGSSVDRADAAGAVAAVRDYKVADAVLAPSSAARGLARVFDAGSVPNPGFVVLNKGLAQPVVDKTREAVLAYGGEGGIDGWRGAASYGGLAGRMGARPRRGVFAAPDVVRLDEQDVLIVPAPKFELATIKQHFWEPTPMAAQ
jgi:hypothetical protein